MTLQLPTLLMGAAGMALLGGTFAALGTGTPERSLGSFTTSLEGRSQNQRHNAVLALQRLNGAVIPPHSKFSFNARVGGFNRDAGYRRAPVSFNGQLIDTWGGGVCQASTTTYNAALLAGLDIVERHPHQFAPSYVPPGRDAAVAFGDIDLRLKNPYAFPVRIEAQVVGTRLLVKLIGRGAARRTSLQSQILGSEAPGEIRLGNPASGSRLRNSGKAGHEVELYRVVNGRRELISHDSYPSMDKVLQYRSR